MTIKEMRTTIDTLAAAHSAARENSNSPRETARVFIHAVGAEEAAQCVAAMIRRASWDGRISREAKAWAQSVALSGEWERHIEDTYCDAIHPAHLSQIAEAMQKELEGCSAEEKEPQEAAQETAPGAKRPKALKKSQAPAATWPTMWRRGCSRNDPCAHHPCAAGPGAPGVCKTRRLTARAAQHKKS